MGALKRIYPESIEPGTALYVLKTASDGSVVEWAQDVVGATVVSELEDVDLTGLANGYVLYWDATSSTWKVSALPSGTAAGTSFSPVGGLSSTDVQAALAELDTEKAPLASPALTGTPTAPTPALGDDDTSIATTAFVNDEIDARVKLRLIESTDDAATVAAANSFPIGTIIYKKV